MLDSNKYNLVTIFKHPEISQFDRVNQRPTLPGSFPGPSWEFSYFPFFVIPGLIRDPGGVGLDPLIFLPTVAPHQTGSYSPFFLFQNEY